MTINDHPVVTKGTRPKARPRPVNDNDPDVVHASKHQKPAAKERPKPNFIDPTTKIIEPTKEEMERPAKDKPMFIEPKEETEMQETEMQETDKPTKEETEMQAESKPRVTDKPQPAEKLEEPVSEKKASVKMEEPVSDIKHEPKPPDQPPEDTEMARAKRAGRPMVKRRGFPNEDPVVQLELTNTQL